jgi:hypothetical protein
MTICFFLMELFLLLIMSSSEISNGCIHSGLEWYDRTLHIHMNDR